MTPSQAITTRARRSPSGRSVRTPTTRPPSRSRPVTVVLHTSVGPGGLGVPGEPVVEVRAERRGAVVRRAAPRLAAVVDGDGLLAVDDHRRAAGDPPLHRRLLPPVGDEQRRGCAGRSPRRTCSCCRGTARARRAAVRSPARAATIAAHEPAGPPPTTMTSKSIGHASARCQPPWRERGRRSSSSVALASAVIGQVGELHHRAVAVGVDADRRGPGAPRPLVCCTAPLMPKARYSCGSTTTPVVPIWRSWPTQPRSVITRVAPTLAPIAAPSSASCSKRGRAVEPGAAADDARCLGQVDGGRVGRQHGDDARRRGASAARRVGVTRPRLAATWDRAATPRSPGCSVATNRSGRSTRCSSQPPPRIRSTPCSAIDIGVGQQRPVHRRRQARCQVAPVGGCRQDDDRFVGEQRGQAGAPMLRAATSPASTVARRWRRRARRLDRVRRCPSRSAALARRTRRWTRRRRPAARRRAPPPRRSGRST